MGRHAKRLQAVAEEEVRSLMAALPPEIRTQAESLPLVYDWRAVEELDEEGVGGTLGLFVGNNLVEAGTGGLPPQIILYLENIWWEAEEDETVYRREIRATLLHELGHYLGLEELDLEERGL